MRPPTARSASGPCKRWARASPALEGRIAERENAVKAAEAAMTAPGFYDDRDAAKAVLDQHQALMWEVGELLGAVGNAPG